MSNVKGKGQRLIPEELLKYLEAFKEAHPDPTAGGSTLADIVDSQGNKRFVEGNLKVEVSESDISTYGFQDIYNKWSLSGTHLMIVACMTLTTGWTVDGTLYSVTLPDYIYNKIFPLVEGGYVSKVSVNDSGNSSKQFILYKGSENQLTIYSGATLVADRVVRVQFDLLIDADYE